MANDLTEMVTRITFANNDDEFLHIDSDPLDEYGLTITINGEEFRLPRDEAEDVAMAIKKIAGKS